MAIVGSRARGANDMFAILGNRCHLPVSKRVFRISNLAFLNNYRRRLAKYERISITSRLICRKSSLAWMRIAKEMFRYTNKQIDNDKE